MSKKRKKAADKKEFHFSPRVEGILHKAVVLADLTGSFKFNSDHLSRAAIESGMGIFPAALLTEGVQIIPFYEKYYLNYNAKFAATTEAERIKQFEKDLAEFLLPENKDNPLCKMEKSALNIIEGANEWAETLGNDVICSQHIMLSILDKGDTQLLKTLREFGVSTGTDSETLLDNLAETLAMEVDGRDVYRDSIQKPKAATEILNSTIQMKPKKVERTPKRVVGMDEDEDILTCLTNEERAVFDMLAKDLTEEIAKANPVIIGRKEELAKLYEMLSRKVKNAPVICGPAGCGKTSLVELMCLEIANKTAPEEFLGKKVYSINCGSIVADSKYRGEMESRIKHLMSVMQKLGRSAYWYFDEVHQILLGKTSVDESTNGSIGDTFKPMLSNPYSPVMFIGSTTEQEYKLIEKDAALARRFAKIIVDEPKKEYAIQIIAALIPHYSEFHKVKVEEDFAEFVYGKSKEIKGRVVPDVSVDIIDIALSKCKLRKKVKLTKDIIEEAANDLMGRAKKKSIGFSEN